MIPYIPQTATINLDRSYYLSPPHFVKVDDNVKRGVNESFILSQLDHPCIQRLVKSEVRDGKHFLTTHYFNGESLENLELSREERKRVHKQLFSVFSYLLDKGVVHGDINVSNILFDGSTIHVIDWETATKEETLQDLYGPPWGILDLLSKI